MLARNSESCGENMPKRCSLRDKLLNQEELQEPTKIVGVRVPRSWHDAIVADGSISDKLLAPLAAHVERIKRRLKKKAA